MDAGAGAGEGRAGAWERGREEGKGSHSACDRRSEMRAALELVRGGAKDEDLRGERG